MGEEATTGRTLTAELCFKLFLELKRGKRLFLILGFLPSSTSVCGTENANFSKDLKITDSNLAGGYQEILVFMQEMA